MADHRERVVLAMGDHESFTAPMARAAAAAERMNRDWALTTATWEPHDWSEWD